MIYWVYTGLPAKHLLIESISVLYFRRDSLQLAIREGGMEEKAGERALDVVKGT